MLFLLFRVQTDRYALDVRRVVEMLPLVALKQLPHSPRGIAGIFSYRGSPVPVLDLSDLMLGQPASPRLSTRIVIVDLPINGNETARLGLIAEHATETIRRPESDFKATGVRSDDTPYLGPVATDDHGLLQLLEVDALLPPSIRDMLFTRPLAVR